MPFYAEDFPSKQQLPFAFGWSLVRSSYRKTPTCTKMRIMEKYAQMEINAGIVQGKTDIQRAHEIFMAEIDLPVAQQTIGNLLDMLLTEATNYVRMHSKTVAPTDKVEDIFKFIIGSEIGVPDKMKNEGCVPLFHSMLAKTIAHSAAKGIIMPQHIADYAISNNLSVTVRIAITPAAPVVTVDPQKTRQDRAAFLARFDAKSPAITPMRSAAQEQVEPLAATLPTTSVTETVAAGFDIEAQTGASTSLPAKSPNPNSF